WTGIPCGRSACPSWREADHDAIGRADGLALARSGPRRSLWSGESRHAVGVELAAHAGATAMHADRFDDAARRLAGATSRRGVFRTLAAVGAAAFGVGTARREAGASRSWVTNCLDSCPNSCVGLGDAVTSCEDGCTTCCWQGWWDESRTAPCMTAMLA